MRSLTWSLYRLLQSSVNFGFSGVLQTCTRPALIAFFFLEKMTQVFRPNMFFYNAVCYMYVQSLNSMTGHVRVTC